MIGLGILAGIVTAVLQATSYVCSASFMQKYRSSLRLVIFSQLVMGAICLPFLPFLFPAGLGAEVWKFFGFVAIWICVFTIGQTAFFNSLTTIESSRISSLLGLKIVVLAAIYVLIFREHLNSWQWLAVFISSAAAVGMNWSGGSHFTFKGLFWLFIALIFYSLTDMTENHLVRMPENINIIKAAFGVGTVCYSVLGVLTLPMLFKFRWTTKQFVKAIPFGITWYLSQVALFVCFGLLGTVFGNVIQASRGVISIGIGVLLMHIGLGKLDSKINRKMWIRRLIAAIMMAVGIIIYALASR